MTISVQTTPNNNSKKEEDSDHADSDSIVTATHTVKTPLLSGCSITNTTTTNTTAATSVTPLHWNKHQQSPHTPHVSWSQRVSVSCPSRSTTCQCHITTSSYIRKLCSFQSIAKLFFNILNTNRPLITWDGSMITCPRENERHY